jgi:hypothetical protein
MHEELPKEKVPQEELLVKWAQKRKRRVKLDVVKA